LTTTRLYRFLIKTNGFRIENGQFNNKLVVY
jgi:hypothetical protein